MKQSIRGDPENGLWATSVGSEKMAKQLQGSRKKDVTGKAQVSKLSGMRDSTNELGKSSSETSKEVLQEIGKVSGVGGKQVEKEARLSENSLESPKKHAGEPECMHWVNATTLVEEPVFKFALVPNTSLIKSEGDIVNQDTEMGPMAMCFNLIQGWTSLKLGPNSGH